MSNYKIDGGRQLHGEIKTLSAKNASLAIIFASLLTDQETIINDVPRIQEVFRVEEILLSIGVKFIWLNKHKVLIKPAKRIKLNSINYEAAVKTRVIIYLLGALVNKFKTFKIPRSGGCKLGKRSIKPHIYALENFGVSVKVTKKYYEFSRKKSLLGANIIMFESGDTATNNAIMAAVLAKGKTVIKMASANYMVQDLCYFLQKMGAKIDGVGTTTLTITGVKKLKGVEYSVMNDPLESMFWLSLAVATNSELLVKACPKDFLELELLKMEKMGFKYEVVKSYKSKNKKFTLIDIQTKKSKLAAYDSKIYARPYPGLNMDNLPFFVPIAAMAKGNTLIHDWCYENRAIYYIELQKLGVKMYLLDPHRVIVEGPTKWQANEIVCPPALRPATIIVIAMLAAKGTSIIRNTYPIDRGYENLYQRLQKIGAKIEEIK